MSTILALSLLFFTFFRPHLSNLGCTVTVLEDVVVAGWIVSARFGVGFWYLGLFMGFDGGGLRMSFDINSGRLGVGFL